MNRRSFLSCLALAPVAGVAALLPGGGTGGAPRLLTEVGIDKWEPVRWISREEALEIWPDPGETRQQITTHNVGQSDAYQTESQIVFNGTEWVDT